MYHKTNTVCIQAVSLNFLEALQRTFSKTEIEDEV